MLDQIVATLQDTIIIYNLTRMNGDEALLRRVPKSPGVYAWFQAFTPPAAETSNAASFADYVVKMIQQPHCLERLARMPPVHQVRLESNRELSKFQCEELIARCQQPEFRPRQQNLWVPSGSGKSPSV